MKGRKDKDMANRIFMKPGKTNDEDRKNFVRFWVKYMKSVSDEEWSRQQNVVINSQIQAQLPISNKKAGT
jgi:hypothetical protein